MCFEIVYVCPPQSTVYGPTVACKPNWLMGTFVYTPISYQMIIWPKAQN